MSLRSLLITSLVFGVLVACKGGSSTSDGGREEDGGFTYPDGGPTTFPDGGPMTFPDGGHVINPDPVVTLDLRSLYGAAPADLATRRQDYDTLVAATCIQGLANRAGANVYLLYKSSGGKDIDSLWLTRMADPAVGADVVTGRKVEAATSVLDLLDHYPGLVKGLAVWDEKVPATLNAAFTAAGADDLIAVRWDADSASLYQQLLARGLTAKVSLVNDDGTSLFHDNGGAAKVLDTTRQTSQSAKADVYVWALEKYLKANKLEGSELGYMLDAFWLAKPQDYNGNIQPTGQLQLTNHDFLVARRGLSFDLSPWPDVAATDAPGQPVGTDPAVLKEILSSAHAQNPGQVLTVRGFFAWQFKYTTLEGLSAGHEPVAGEWESVQVMSPYATGLDADAPGEATMANASFYAHVPVSSTPEPQARPTPEDLVGEGFLSGLANNGGFEDGESDWTVHTTNHVIYTDTTSTGARAHGGLRYLECNTSAVGNDAEDNLYRDGPAVAAGQKVTLRAFVRAPGNPVNGQLVLWGTGGTSENAVLSFTAKSSWQELRVTLTVAHAGHTGTRGQIYLKSTGGNLDVDDVAFYQGDAAAGSVVPANYLLWYVGDYDSSAWMYAFTPSTWDASGRGVIPMAWGLSGHVASRFPLFLKHALATRTARDFFVAADSGPGYGNPSQMAADVRTAWTNQGVQDARVLDTSVGWLLDPKAPADSTHVTAVTPFMGDGVMMTVQSTQASAAPGTVLDHAPLINLTNLSGTAVADRESAVIASIGSGAPGAATFHAFRVVLVSNNDLTSVSSNLVSDHAVTKTRVVDPYTFFELARAHWGGDNKHRASYRGLVLPASLSMGKTVAASVTVHNDGWETWHATGANNYRLGVNLSGAVPAVRSLPSLVGSYTTRVSLPHDVAPGEEVTLTFTVPAPSARGTATLQLDMVQEGVTWFESQGDVPLQTSLPVP